MAHQLFLLLLVVPASLSLPASKLPVLFQHSGPSHNVIVFRGANVELARQAGLLPSLPTIGLAREGKSDDGSSDDSGADFSADTGAADNGSNSGGNSGADIIDFGSDSGSGLDANSGDGSGLNREGKSDDDGGDASGSAYASPPPPPPPVVYTTTAAPPPPPPPPTTYAPAPPPAVPAYTSYRPVVYQPAAYRPAPIVYKPAPVVYKPAPPPPPPAYKPAPSYHEPAYTDLDVKYNWEYAVLDDYTSNNFGHKESRAGDHAEGVYYVALPDGRLQTVTYVVDGYGGYVPVVEYAGEAQYPPEPAPYHA